MSAPVPFTCPTIDGIIEELKEAEGYLENILEDFDYMSIGDIKEKIKDAKRLIGYQYGHRGTALEEVRRMNDTLRSWGEAQEERANEAEKDAEYYKEQSNAA